MKPFLLLHAIVAPKSFAFWRSSRASTRIPSVSVLKSLKELRSAQRLPRPHGETWTIPALGSGRLGSALKMAGGACSCLLLFFIMELYKGTVELFFFSLQTIAAYA